MTLAELYVHYSCRWTQVARQLGVAESTVHYWKKRGGIPIQAQKMIEAVTNGALKAGKDEGVGRCETCGRMNYAGRIKIKETEK